jgi:hypothetical protein
MRSFATLVIALGLGLVAASVSAQDAQPPPSDAAETPPPPITETPAPQASIELASPPPTPQPPTPPPAEVVPPIMIAVLTSGRVPDDVTAAVQTALLDGVRPMSGGRPVLPLAMPEMQQRLAACADAPCTGAFLGETGAIGAIIARLSRRGARGAVTMTLDIVDPVSGATRLPQISVELADAAAVPAALAPIVEQLRPVMFTPPPAPPTLLITVNVDGATVIIDDVNVGTSPIAAQRLAVGHHVVMISREGYAGTRRTVDLEGGEQARLDVNLAMLEGTTVTDEGVVVPHSTSAEPAITEQWWFWTILGGGVLVVAGIVIGAVVASQPTTHPDPMGIGLPGIRF